MWCNRNVTKGEAFLLSESGQLWYLMLASYTKILTDLEEAIHILLVHPQHTESSYFCTGKEEGRRRRKKEKKKSWPLRSSSLTLSEEESRAFFMLLSVLSLLIFEGFGRVYVSQCSTTFREGLLFWFNGTKWEWVNSYYKAACAVAAIWRPTFSNLTSLLGLWDWSVLQVYT